MLFVGLTAGVFASGKPRRVFGPAAELLSFAGPNESNQSKVPEHTFVKSAWRQTGAAFWITADVGLFPRGPFVALRLHRPEVAVVTQVLFK